MHEEILLPYIRSVTDEDREKLPKFSYSKLEVFGTCEYRYHLQYNQGMYTDDTTLALELGSLCHYILEQKGKMLKADTGIVDYSLLDDILENGVIVDDEKTHEHLLGVRDLKKKYFDIWYEADNASGMTYEDKMKVFNKVLQSEMENDNGWTPLLFEYHFEFVWDNRVIIHGFIDRIDTKDGEYRTVDYKTSKRIYDDSKLPTSLQFGIYALAILHKFGKLPAESIYRFILIDEIQLALTKGWEKRLIKSLTTKFDRIDLHTQSELWKPSPSPLCYWCNFAKTNPNAHDFKDVCVYHCLWTPTKKTFEVNQKYNTLDAAKSKLNERKLVF